MKHLTLLLLSAGLLSACAHRPTSNDSYAATQSSQPRRNPAVVVPRRVMANGVEVQKVDFRPGISSATVERMGRDAACQGGTGAGLVSEAGPIEVYRMSCDNGNTFMARCELRQCKPMNAGEPTAAAGPQRPAGQ
jgi:hypothetical protein